MPAGLSSNRSTMEAMSVDFDSWFVVVFVVAGGYVLVAGGRTPAGESSSTA